MKLFEQSGTQLKTIRSNPFKLEKEIQNVVEGNVEELFGLEFVESELSIGGFRFDTLCFDNETNSFVIIEYKKGSSYSVIDQGYTYLSILLNNKSDFILEYNETKGKPLKRDEVDWSQSRIIFVSPKFNEYQLNSVNFKDIPFELWEIKRYSNDTIGMNRIQVKSNESIETTSKSDSDGIVERVSREVKVYDDESFFNRKKTSDEVKELYFSLKERVLELEGVRVVHLKSYISFKRKSNIIDVDYQSGNLWIWINLQKGELEDPKELTRDVSEIGHYGNGDYELKVYPDTDMDYVMYLIKQSYEKQGD